jgi:predicted Zn-dependent protease
VDAARAIFERLHAAEPRFIPAAIMLGETQLVADDEAGALETWLSGYRDTGSPVFLARIEDHFIEGQDPRRALETVRKLIAEEPRQLMPRYFLGRLYHRLEMHEEALKALEGLDERIGSSPMYHFVLGRLRERRGEFRQAAEAYATCARQLGVHETQFRCRVCRAPHSEWQDRCPACGSWSSVELELTEEQGGTDAIRQREAVIWAGPESWDLADLEEPKTSA